jgi:hypothetical protein
MFFVFSYLFKYKHCLTKPQNNLQEIILTGNSPETFRDWIKQDKSLRKRLLDIPFLPVEGLRDCQIIAINNLDNSLKQNKPRALIPTLFLAHLQGTQNPDTKPTLQKS